MLKASCDVTQVSRSLVVSQWLEHVTGKQNVTGLIPVGDSDFFFVQ